jgi:hypothetical protein
MAKKTITKKITVKKAAAKKPTAKKTIVKKPAVKKTITKKLTAKKSTAKKPAVKKTKTVDTQKAALIKELKALIPKLDSEGLAFLVKQSRIHLYNMQVDELNNATRAAHLASIRSAKSTGAGKKPSIKNTAKDEKLRIIGTDSGSGYFLFYQNGNVAFSRDEMIRLVNIVNAGGSALDVTERLFNWLKRERSDVFHLIPIADKFDSRLKSLAVFIKKNFKLRGT